MSAIFLEDLSAIFLEDLSAIFVEDLSAIFVEDLSAIFVEDLSAIFVADKSADKYLNIRRNQRIAFGNKKGSGNYCRCPFGICLIRGPLSAFSYLYLICANLR